MPSGYMVRIGILSPAHLLGCGSLEVAENAEMNASNKQSIYNGLFCFSNCSD